MLIDFKWEAVGQRSTGWCTWWQKHSWNKWTQVDKTEKAVAATEEAVVDAAVVGSLGATKAVSEGFEKSFEDTTTNGTVIQAAVEATEAEETVADTAEEAEEAAAEAVEAAQAMGAAEAAAEAAKAKVAGEAAVVEWRCFLAATEEAEEEWWQLEAANQDVQQWVQEVEQQAAAKGTAGVGIEAARAAEVVVLGAAMEPVVWDTGEAVAEAEATAKAKAEEVGNGRGSRDASGGSRGRCRMWQRWRTKTRFLIQEGQHYSTVIETSLVHFLRFKVQRSRFKIQGSDA